MKIKIYKYIIFSFLILLFLIGISFYQYFDENFSYAKDYYVIKENCYEGLNPHHEYCEEWRTYYKTEEDFNSFLEYYIEHFNPKAAFKKLDTITLTCEIVENTYFRYLQFFSPLLIIMALIGTIHSDLSSGMLKNYLLRMKYKDYLKKVKKIILKVSLLTPVALITIFIVSMLITRFNFNFNAIDGLENFAVYEKWKYSNFLLYGLGICLIQFFINILYCNIALYCCRNNKNKLVAIFMSYVTFFLINVFVYIVVYSLIINKILGFHNLSDFFAITGYWFFDDGKSCLYVIIISFILQAISSIFISKYYKNKEEVIKSSENQIA